MTFIGFLGRSFPVWMGVSVVVLLGGVSGCKNSLSWEHDLHIPVLDDMVTWQDFVPDSLIEPGVNGGPAHFVFSDTLDNWDWSDYLSLPDTDFVSRFDGQTEPFNGTIVVVEGNEVLGYSEPFNFDIVQLPGMELTEATLSGGTMTIEVVHSLQLEVEMMFNFPDINSMDGDGLAVPVLLPPATATAAGVGTVSTDLENIHIDFTGEFGTETNTLSVFVVALAGEVSNPDGYDTIDPEDSIVVSVSFNGVTVQTLGGYFGQRTLSSAMDVQLIDTIPVPEPVIDLEGAQAELHFTNTVGADFRLYVDTIEVADQLVEGSLISGHEIPRATWVNGEPVPVEWSLDLAMPGSNFLELLEGLPESMRVAARFLLNPEDMSDLLIDRMDARYPPTFWYDVRIPIKAGARGLMFTDTLDVSGLDEFPNFDGFLHLDLSNTFPIEVEGRLRFEMSNGDVWQDTALVAAGSVPLGILGESTVSIPLNEDIALPGGTLVMEVWIDTYGPQPFTGEESLRVQGRLEGTQLMVVE